MLKKIALLFLFLSISVFCMKKDEEKLPLLAEEELLEVISFDTQQSVFHSFPPEVILSIFKNIFNHQEARHAKFEQLKRISLVCKKFNILSHSQHLAHDIFGGNFESISKFYFDASRLRLKKLLEQKPTEKNWAMRFAILEENIPMIKDISSLGFDPNTLFGWDGYEADAICRAAGLNKSKALKALLAHPKVDPNIPDSNGDTALMIAADQNYIETAKILLENPKIDVTRRRTSDNRNALAIAIERANPEIVEMIAVKEEQLLQQENRNCFCLCSVQ